MTIQPHPTDLNKTFDEVIFLSTHLVGSKELTIVDETNDLPHMNVDDARIQQVIERGERGGRGGERERRERRRERVRVVESRRE
jgi:hypothetical protein